MYVYIYIYLRRIWFFDKLRRWLTLIRKWKIATKDNGGGRSSSGAITRDTLTRLYCADGRHGPVSLALPVPLPPPPFRNSLPRSAALAPRFPFAARPESFPRLSPGLLRPVAVPRSTDRSAIVSPGTHTTHTRLRSREYFSTRSRNRRFGAIKFADGLPVTRKSNFPLDFFPLKQIHQANSNIPTNAPDAYAERPTPTCMGGIRHFYSTGPVGQARTRNFLLEETCTFLYFPYQYTIISNF